MFKLLPMLLLVILLGCEDLGTTSADLQLVRKGSFLDDDYRFAFKWPYSERFLMKLIQSSLRDVSYEELKNKLNVKHLNYDVTFKKAHFVDNYYNFSNESEKVSQILRLRKRYANKRINRCEMQHKKYSPDLSDSIPALEKRVEFQLVNNKTGKRLPCDRVSSQDAINFFSNHFKELNLNTINDLESTVKIVTFRRRYHFLHENPWGVNPNPRQVFFVTLDKVRSYITGEYLFHEVEIQFDRSTLAPLLNDISNNEELLVKKSAEVYRNEIDKIILDLQRLILERIKKTVNVEWLPLKSKYSQYLGLKGEDV